MIKRLLSGVCLTVGLVAGANALPAQSMEGSVTVRGAADSVFHGFAAFVKQRGLPIQAQDSVRRTLRFLPNDTNGEAVEMRFTPRADSTVIESRGARGGIVALVMGMGTLQTFLRQRDSTSALPPRREPRTLRRRSPLRPSGPVQRSTEPLAEIAVRPRIAVALEPAFGDSSGSEC